MISFGIIVYIVIFLCSIVLLVIVLRNSHAINYEHRHASSSKIEFNRQKQLEEKKIKNYSSQKRTKQTKNCDRLDSDDGFYLWYVGRGPAEPRSIAPYFIDGDGYMSANMNLIMNTSFLDDILKYREPNAE